MIREVIETCPSMQTVTLNEEDIRSPNWRSISESMGKVQATLKRFLRVYIGVNEKSLNRMYDFLPTCPHPVHLQLEIYDFVQDFAERTSWISRILGSPVFALSMVSISLRSEQILHHLIQSNNATIKELELIVSAPECTNICNALQDLVYVEKMTLIFLQRDEVLPFKSLLLDAFNKKYQYQEDLHT